MCQQPFYYSLIISSVLTSEGTPAKERDKVSWLGWEESPVCKKFMNIVMTEVPI
jgi:hypothetical protein